MARIELSPIPEELSDEEKQMLRYHRIAAIVNDQGGEDRNPDGKCHPFHDYQICHLEVTDGNGTLSKCGCITSSMHSMLEHQAAHTKVRMELGYNRKLGPDDKPV